MGNICKCKELFWTLWNSFFHKLQVRHKKQHKYIPTHDNLNVKNGMTDCTECDQKVQITKLVLHYKQSHNSLPPGQHDLSCNVARCRVNTFQSRHQVVIRQSSGSHCAVIVQSSGSHRAVIGHSSGIHQAVIRQSSGSHGAVIGQSLGSHRAVIVQSLGSHRAVIGQSSGSHRAVIGQSSAVIGQSTGSHQVVIRQSSGSHQAVIDRDIKAISYFYILYIIRRQRGVSNRPTSPSTSSL